jgi:alpha-mannosidase
MIGNAHIDPVWLWQWQEGFHEVKSTFRSALDRLSEYDDFTFISSSAAFYEWIEDNDPAMFAEIKARVAEGRWQIVGGWWIQPDCNLPGGESFVRQGLYGQRYFMRAFGRMARVGYNVDSFGHHGMLPQILLKSGLEYYVFMRPMPHEKGLPGRVFWWEADDGSRVLALRLPFEYCTWGKDLEQHVQRCAAEIRAPVDAMVCFYGVGNHGGGPTRENIESIHRLQNSPGLPRLVFSTPDQFFENVRARNVPLPVVHDDMQHHASGCYAAHSGVKRWNRQAEHRLLTAEKWAAVATRTLSQRYPTPELSAAWKAVLFNQFHDILAGTSLESAYDDARDAFGEASAIAGRAHNHAVQALAWNINIEPEEGMRPIVVFNPHAWPSRANVELEFGRLNIDDGLLDDGGRPVPFQTVQSQATASGRNRLCFVADLPPLGYATYRLAPGASQSDAKPITASDTALENDALQLEFDPRTGFIKSLRDKARQLEVFSGPAGRPVVLHDPSDTWSHNVYRFDQECGEFRASSVCLVEHGPVKSVVRVVSHYEASELVQDFALYRDINRIDVRVTVDWHERFKALKLRFPTNFNFMKVTCEIPYGHIERFANGEEEPGQSWVDITGTARDTGDLYGLSILNDGKHSYDVEVRDIGLTVLRSPIYAHHIPAAPQEGARYSFIDQGRQTFTYSLLPHPGGWETAGTVRSAQEINQPPFALAATSHAGPLPQRESFASVDQDNIIISAMKQAEEGDDLILRAYETAHIQTAAVICLPQWGRNISVVFGPCEIKTLRIPRDLGQPVTENNLLELPLQDAG